MLHPMAIMLALVGASPALVGAFRGEVPVEAALERLLVALVVCGIGAAILRMVWPSVAGSATASPARPHRRRTDADVQG